MNEPAKIKIDQLSAPQILAAENFSAVKSEAYTLMDNLDWDGALDFGRKLENKMRQFTPGNPDEKYWYGIAKFWVYRLKLFTFVNLNPAERQDLVQNHAVEIFKNGLDLKSYVFRYIDFFDSRTIIEQEIKSLVFSLQNNKELLGDRQVLKQVNFLPTISDWIVQYQTSINKRGLVKIKPGVFEITSFLNTSQYIKYLSAEEKALLKSVLDFYNWLQNPIVFTESAQPAYMTTQRATLPRAPSPRLSTGVPSPVVKISRSETRGEGNKVGGNLPPPPPAKFTPIIPRKPTVVPVAPPEI